MMKKEIKLGTEKISKLVLEFSITTLAGFILNSIYTLTDALFVSHSVGDNAMGGISLILPFTLLQGAIATTVGSGASAIVSRKLGESKPQEAGQITFNAMLTFYITAVLTTALGFLFMTPLLKAFGCTGELEVYAREYFTIILIGNVFSTGFSSIIRAEGKMLYSLLIWVIPISINIGLDALFILKLGMGVKGSALATVVCQFTSFCMSVLFFTCFTTQSFKGAKPCKKDISRIIGIGLPSLIQTGSLSIMSALFNNAISRVGGELGVNSFAYISKLTSFGIAPLTAFASAIIPIVGYNYGAKKYNRVKETVSFCIKASLSYGLVAVVTVALLSERLIGIFTESADVIDLASRGLRIVVFSLLFSALPMLMGAFYQSLGKKAEAYIMFSSNLIFSIILIIILPNIIQLDGVWLSYTLASLLSAILSVALLLKNRHKSLNFKNV